MATLYRTLTGQSQKSTESAHPADLSKVTTTGTLAGTVNHLTEHQNDQLLLFKEKLQKTGWWRPDAGNGRASHDDGTLLRYLRARKFDVNGAYGQFTDTEKWMKEQHIDELYENFDIDLYEKARTMYPQWTGHRDKRGIPVYVYVIKHLDSKNVSKYQKESQEYKKTLPNHKKLSTPAKLLPLFALYHNLLNFVLPFVSTLERPHPEIPVTATCNIVDISGVGLTQFWNLKQHMQDASVLATAHYPETLDRIFIVGAPAFFPTVWGWIKRWFDPVTVSKIFILGKHEVKPTLLRFMDMRSFPKRYGGELDWDFGDVPHPEPEVLSKLETDGHKGWLPGPALWLENHRVAVGSDHGKLRHAGMDLRPYKPPIYAADHTDAPVHESTMHEETTIHNGGPPAYEADPPHQFNGTVEKPTDHAAEGVAVAGPAVTAAAISATAAVAATQHTPEKPASPIKDVPQDEIRRSPIGDSPVHVAKNQPAPPAITAEYISPQPTAADPTAHPAALDPPSEQSLPPPITEPTPTPAPTQERPTPAQIPSPATAPSTAPPSIAALPHPGPQSTHEHKMTSAIASQMQGESISVLPAVHNPTPPSDPATDSHTNGSIASPPQHPEYTVTSDASKGLALQTEKLDALRLNGSPIHANSATTTTSGLGAGERPPMERFVTALEG